MKRLLAFAMEEATQEQELEAVMYGKITNFEGLQQCAYKEEHEQLECRLESGVKCRVRKTTRDGKTDYVFTVKKKLESVGIGSNNMEYNTVVDKAFHETFKNACDHYFVKTRYVYLPKSVTMSVGEEAVDIPDVKYEVDVYQTLHGPSEWCKLDVELNSINEVLRRPEFRNVEGLNLKIKVSNLPLGLQGTYLQGQETDEQKAFTQKLFEGFKRRWR